MLNAAGPWVDAVRRLADPAAGTSVTPSKGAHLVVPAPPGWEAAVTIPLDRSRVSFGRDTPTVLARVEELLARRVHAAPAAR